MAFRKNKKDEPKVEEPVVEETQEVVSPAEEVDQDGNVRTSGYSYGVSPDDTEGTVPEEENEGEVKEREGDGFKGSPAGAQVYVDGDIKVNTNDNSKEFSVAKQQKLEKELSDPSRGIQARVITSVANYVKIKFYKNNKPFAIYKSRKLNKAEAKEFLNYQIKEQGL